jgi:hypothetical protein
MTSKRRTESNPASAPSTMEASQKAGATVELAETDCNRRSEVSSELQSESGKVRDVYLLRDRIMNPGPIVCTRSHDVIWNWAHDRQARPAVSRVARAGETVTLCFVFPNSREKDYEEIDWAEWFTHFDEAGYIFLYEEKPGDTKSEFYQFGRPKD